MKLEKNKLDLLLEIVGQTAGFTPRTPTDFVHLASAILKKTGRTIGLSTLKRLWGYVKDQTGTSYSTLSLLCRYIGYQDWDSFCHFATLVTDDNSSGFTSDSIIESRLLNIGTIITLSLGINKRCVIVKTDDPDKFEIKSADNIKLKAGDTIRVGCIAEGKPFFATDCRRGTHLLGNYTGAQAEGIKRILINE